MEGTACGCMCVEGTACGWLHCQAADRERERGGGRVDATAALRSGGRPAPRRHTRSRRLVHLAGRSQDVSQGHRRVRRRHGEAAARRAPRRRPRRRRRLDGGVREHPLDAAPCARGVAHGSLRGCERRGAALPARARDGVHDRSGAGGRAVEGRGPGVSTLFRPLCPPTPLQASDPACVLEVAGASLPIETVYGRNAAVATAVRGGTRPVPTPGWARIQRELLTCIGLCLPLLPPPLLPPPQTGFPALTIPVGAVGDLPVGVELLGAPALRSEACASVSMGCLSPPLCRSPGQRPASARDRTGRAGPLRAWGPRAAEAHPCGVQVDGQNEGRKDSETKVFAARHSVRRWGKVQVSDRSSRAGPRNSSRAGLGSA